MVLLVFMVGTALPAMSSLSQQSASAQSSIVASDPHPHWHPPPAPNATTQTCFKYTNATGWIKIDCGPQIMVTSEQLANEGGGSYCGTSCQAPRGETTSSSSPNSSEVFINFDGFTAEKDNLWGGTSWSVQDYTNDFTGSNGLPDWVNFVFQNPQNGADGLSPQVCIEQWYYQNGKWNLGQNPRPCVSASYETLSNYYQGYLEGYIGGNGYLGTQYCDVSTSTCWAEGGISDLYGLEYNNRWTGVFGQIFGLAGGSQAQFTSPTNMETIVYGTTETSAYADSFSGTAESNNLSYTGSPSVSCGSGTCTWSEWSRN